MSRTRSMRRAAGLVAGLLVAQLLNPGLARATDPFAGITEEPAVAEPAAPASTTGTVIDAAAPYADAVGGRVAIPVIRDGAGLSLYVLRLAAFGLTTADLAAAGLPLVTPPGPGSSPVAESAGVAVALETVIATVGRLSGTRTAAETGGSQPAAVAAATAAAGDVAISVYSDQSNLALGDMHARTAWSDATSVLAAQAGVTFDVVIYQEDASAYPDDLALEVRDVDTLCGLQRFARYEETLKTPAQGVLVFSDDKLAYRGGSVYGIAIDGDMADRMRRGDSIDYCTPVTSYDANGEPEHTRRSPAYMPAAHVSTDLGWVPNIVTEKNAPSHWAAHELAHMFGMRHRHGQCWSHAHQHQTLELASSDT